MKKMSLGPIVSFLLLLSFIIFLAFVSTNLLVKKEWFRDFYSIAYVVSITISFFAWSIVVYRIFLSIFKLPEGHIEPNSKRAFIINLDTLFYLMIFNTLIRTDILPVWIKTLVYFLLGMKIGLGTFVPGTVLDPPLTEIGSDTIIGHAATIFSHAMEGDKFSIEKVILGNNVTVGAGAIIMSGVIVGDNAVIAAGAVVKKGTKIGAGEHWGGVPAKRIDNKGHSGDVRLDKTA